MDDEGNYTGEKDLSRVKIPYLEDEPKIEIYNHAQELIKPAEYEALRNFASTEFFNAQSPVDQQVIREADWRLQNNLATPADYQTIQNFFNMAKYAYDTKNSAQTSAPKPAQKKSNPQFPHTNKLNGVPGSGGGGTIAFYCYRKIYLLRITL